MQITLPSHLSDIELIAAVAQVAARDREAGAQLIAHLAEMDARELHLRHGYPSLFVYCRDVLGLSEWEAYNRIEAARTARRFPIILELLAEGAVTLTAVRLLGPHLTADNHLEVLACARGMTKVQVQEIVARLAPLPDVRTSIRRVPTKAGSPATPFVGTPGRAVRGDAASATDGACHPAPVAPSAAPGQATEPLSEAALPAPSVKADGKAAVVAALSPDRYRFQLTIGGSTLEKLLLAKDMLAHALPSGDDDAVLDRALTALLAELAKKKFADTTRPRASRVNGRSGPATRYIPAHVKRAVWLRDLGRCAFLGAGGHRCMERRFVEFHHVDPYALGGEATVDGIQLRCRSHNDYEGRLYFGKRRGVRELVPEQARSSEASARPGTSLDRLGASKPIS